MGKYTSYDNRSMQLNPNNDRYWSSRGYDDDDFYDDYSSNYNREREGKKENENRKKLIDELSFTFSGKQILFKDNDVIDLNNPLTVDFDYLSKNIINEELKIKTTFNIKRKNLRDFLLNNVCPKYFEMRYNWLLRNLVEEDGGRYGRYEYLCLQMFESENWTIFKFEKYYQGCWSFFNDLENPRKWIFNNTDTSNPNIIECLSELFEKEL